MKIKINREDKNKVPKIKYLSKKDKQYVSATFNNVEGENQVTIGTNHNTIALGVTGNGRKEK